MPRMEFMTLATVSPGRMRKFTRAVAAFGRTLSRVPPWTTLTEGFSFPVGGRWLKRGGLQWPRARFRARSGGQTGIRPSC